MADGLNTKMSFAVVANKEKFLKHKHAWKAWRLFKEFGCRVYPVAEDLARIEGCKGYSSLAELRGTVDVVVLCVHLDLAPEIVEQTAAAGAFCIWFQEKTGRRKSINSAKKRDLKSSEAVCSSIKFTLSPLLISILVFGTG